MVRVDLHGLTSHHVARNILTLLEGLGLVDLLHLGGVTELSGENEEGLVPKLRGDRDLGNVVTKVLLPPISERFVHLLEFVVLFLVKCAVVEDVQVVLRDRFDLLLLVLAHVLEDKLVDGVVEDENLVAGFDVAFKDRRLDDGRSAVAGQVQDGVLVFLHPANVFIKRCHLALVSRRVEPQQLCQFHPVDGVFHDSQFDVLAEGFPEKVILVLLVFLLFFVVGGFFGLLLLLLGLFITRFLLFVFILVAGFSEVLDHVERLFN